MENSEKNRTKDIFNKIQFLFAIIGIAIAIVSIVTIYYNSKLEKQIVERDNLINQLTFSDNLVKEYFDIRHDSIKGTTSYILKESKKNVRTINTEKIIYTTETIVESDTLLYNSYKNLIEKYNNLVGNFNSISTNYYNIKDSLETNKALIQLIQKNYPIEVFVENEQQRQRISIKSAQLDSALLLLPHYRDKLKYDPKEKSWIITLPKK